MSAYAPKSPAAYRSNAVLTASHEQLVIALYDGARRFLYQASVAMTDKDVATAHFKQKRTEDIIRHLRDTLDMEQGELPQRLHALYTFWLEHLRKARLAQNPKMLEEVSDMVGKLRESWATVARP
jgi:flagellar protein FliS